MVFHSKSFYSTTLAPQTWWANAFLRHQRLEPLLHRFVSQSRHTHHRYFIDPRHIGHTIHLWTAFVALFQQPQDGSSLPTSPGFGHQPFGLRPPEYQGGRFKALPFHSTLRIISSPRDSFLLCLTFSVRNVSHNYLNHTHTVSKERADKIAAAIEELHYIPNQMARTLRSRSSSSIGVILPNIQDNYYVQIFQAIESFFNAKGYCVNIGITKDMPELEQKYILDFLQKQTAGLILVTSQPDQTGFFQNHIIDNRIPFLHLDRKIMGIDAGFLGFDNRKTVCTMTDRRIKQGRRRIVLFAGLPEYSSESDAVSGYLEAFRLNGLEADRSNIIHTTPNKESAFRAAIQYFSVSHPEVIITTSKLLTVGVLEAAALSGLMIPENIEIAALGEDNWNRFSDFAGVRFTAREAILLGQEAAEQLYQQIKTPKLYEPKVQIFTDKGEESLPVSAISPHTGYSGPLTVLMLETLQVELFSGLLPHFKNRYHTDVQIHTIAHNQLLNAITDNKNNADVIMYDMPWLNSLARSGVLADISSNISSGGFDRDIYLQNCLERYGMADGKYFGLPFMYAPQILFYLRDLFEDRAVKNGFKKSYGVRLRPPRSWKEFNLIAEYFTRSQNPDSPTLYGTAVPAAYQECLVPEIYMRMRGYGSEIYNDQYKIVFNSHQTCRAYENLLELLSSSAPDYLTLNDRMAVDLFLDGTIAMLVTYPSFISNVNDIQKSCLAGKVGFADIPGKAPILGGWGLGISSRTKKFDAAFQFIHWACGEEIANYSTIMAGQSAIAKVFDNNELVSLYLWLPLYKETYALAEPVIPPSAHNREVIPQDKIDAVIAAPVYQMLNGKMNSEEAVIETCKNLIALFNQYGYHQK